MKKVKTEKPNASGAATFQRVSLKEIVPSPFQARRTFEKSADWPEFVASVRTSGVVQPGVARVLPDGTIELVCGERRFRASLQLDLPDLPVMLHPNMSDAEAQDIVAIENLQREGLNEIEEAQGYKDWIDRLTCSGASVSADGKRQSQTAATAQCASRKEAIEYIASRIHRQRATIYERLRLTELTKDEAALLTSGQISASVASLLPTIPDPKKRAEYVAHLTKQLEYGNAPSVRSVREYIEDECCTPLREAPFKQDADYQDEKRGLLPTCAACPKRTGNMLEQFPELKARPNVCTDPSCYKLKVALEADAELNLARSRGKTVLTAKEYKQRQDEFVKADEFVYAKNKNGNWTELMGKHKPEAVIVGTPQGLRTVYPKAEALEACKKNKVQFRAEEKPMTAADRAKREAEEKAAKVRREKLCDDLAPRLMQFIRKLTPKQGWELVFAELVESYDRENLWLKGETASEKVLAHVFNRSNPVYYGGDWNKDSVKLWKSASVDLIAEEKKVLAEEAKKAKAPEEFVKELLGLAKAAGFKPLTQQFEAITNMATRAGLKDIDQCETEADRHILIEQFKTDFPNVIPDKSKAKTQKPTKKKAGGPATKKGKKK
jgi:ParB/RepB/Spo0J family partition protein